MAETTGHDADWNALADRMEREDCRAQPSGRVQKGRKAAEAGRRVLAEVGRPSLGSAHARRDGGSPRRQVRLPIDVNEGLDAHAAPVAALCPTSSVMLWKQA